MFAFQQFCDTGLKLVKSLSETLQLSEIDHPDKYIRDTEFEQNPSLFSNKGKVLYANKNCINYEKIKNLFNSIGNIDYIYSIFKLTEKFDTCFPSVLETKTPIIDYKNVYHPYLESKGVKNSITIGDKYPQNVMITGPNAGGKSTLIKSLAISLLSSQTLGIAFADGLKFTPFNILNSYLNIPDCKGKESLFEAEMHRSLKHINQCKEMPAEHKSFIIMDEIFSSTNPNEGISGAYAIAKKMASFKNSICIITTHFNQLTSLEQESGFKNYKIPCEYDSMNKINYPYKLEEGVSDQNIALELLHAKGFDDDIIETAKEKSIDLINKEKNNMKNNGTINLEEAVFEEVVAKEEEQVVAKEEEQVVAKEEEQVVAKEEEQVVTKEEEQVVTKEEEQVVTKEEEKPKKKRGRKPKVKSSK